MSPGQPRYMITPRMLEDALAATRGNVAAAARAMGISRQLLQQHLKKHGLQQWAARLRNEAERERLKGGE